MSHPRRALARDASDALRNRPAAGLSSVSTEVEGARAAHPVAHLQRTVGNRATAQLLHAPQSITGHSPAATQLVVQRKPMSFKEFLKKSGQDANPAAEDIFNGRAGRAELNKQRHALNPQADDLNAVGADQANINGAYLAIEKSGETIETLTNLHDTVRMWQALFANTDFAAKHGPLLNEVAWRAMKQVTRLVAQENRQKKPQDSSGTDFWGFGRDALKAMSDAVVPNRKRRLDDNGLVKVPEMPAFMQEVGVPKDFFIDHFADITTGELNSERIFYFKQAVDLLKAARDYMGANLDTVDEAFDQLTALGVPSVYMLRSITLSKFGGVLEGIVGTDREATTGQALTPAEIQAIVTYSGGTYKEINKQARETKTEAPMKARWQRRGGQASAQAPAEAPATDHRQIMQLAVSGLNKLPKYQGIAYRGLVTPPSGFEQFIQPGAITGDLGFSSATPAMRAVYTFLSLEKGPRNIFYIINSKTASRIVEISKNVHEAEVLFRPGTLFRVDKVWTHDEHGRVPEDAPPEAQLILRRTGAVKNEAGAAFNPQTHNQAFQTRVVMVSEV